MKPLTAIFTASLLTTSAFGAEDHLVPEISPFLDPKIARMELAFAERFEAVLDNDAEAWVYAGEGLTPPFVVGIRKRAGARYIFGAAPKYGMVQLLQQCELPVSWPTGEKIVRLWRKMLLQTAPDPASAIGPDGETYHFALHGDYHWMAGTTWSPTTPKLSRLVQIVDKMRMVCESGKPLGLSSLERDIDDLMMRR